MEDFRTAMPDEYAAVMAMIPLAEGKPAILVDARDRSVFVCRRVSGSAWTPGCGRSRGSATGWTRPRPAPRN